jgi:peptidoglycan hydrolase-like protein with peptidoglycan-binding domain
MKKFLLVATFLFAFVFSGSMGINSVEAYEPYNQGCMPGNLYNPMTGQPCPQQGTYIPGCENYVTYSIITGQPCLSYGQTYPGYPTYPTQPVYPTPRELSFGSRGEDVKQLQQALQGQGYFRSRIDGVFGPLTLRAVINYQTGVGLPVTGKADFQTLSTLGLGSPVVPPVNPIPPICYQNPYGQTQTQYSSQYPCYPGGAPTISQVSGPQFLNVNQEGTWTVNASSYSGGNLTYSVNWGDNVFFAPSPLAPQQFAYPEQNATFTHRYVNAGTYTATFTVTNSYGQTAQSTITVTVGGGVVNQNPPVVYTISPTSGPVGTQVNIYGTNLSGSSVTFSNYPVQLTSNSDTFISFIVPANLNYCPYPGMACTMVFIPPTIGNHTIQVTNSRGNAAPMTFTVTGPNTTLAPTISYITPSSGARGSQVTIVGTNFASTGNTVYFGNATVSNLSSFNGTSLTFNVPYNVTASSFQSVSVWVTNQSASSSNSASFLVTN